jgi:hypothetical protein
VQRIIELLRELPADDDEDPTAKQDENRPERGEIPGREAEAESRERVKWARHRWAQSPNR